MSIDQETIEKEILAMLGGRLKRSIKPKDLVQEIASKFELAYEDQKPVWAAVKALQLKELIHEEKYLESGKGWKPKTVDPEKVEALKVQIIEALTADDYQVPKDLQTKLGADFANFKEAQDKLKLEDKIKIVKDPKLGWLIALNGGRQVTQKKAAAALPTPSKPAKAGAVDVDDFPY